LYHFDTASLPARYIEDMEDAPELGNYFSIIYVIISLSLIMLHASIQHLNNQNKRKRMDIAILSLRRRYDKV